MTACRRSHVSAFLVLSVLLLVLAPNSMLAQAVLGTVKSVPLAVYVEMSADSRVVTTLPPGKSVQITFSVTGSDGAWCKVADVDSSETLGYVRCNGLDRQNAPSEVAAGPGAASSAAVGQSFNNAAPSRAQKEWAIAASAILATFNHERLDTLSTGSSVIGVRSLLRNSWGVSNRDELLQTLEWLDNGGHRQLFTSLGARTANISADELSNAVSRLNSEDANSVMVAHRYYEKYEVQSIAAWDYGRYVNLCRWGVDAGYITEAEAWPRMMHAAQILQQSFSSWSEFGENYLVGREFWSLRQTRIDGQAMRAIYRKLLNEPGSPWSRISWNLPLERASSQSPNSPVVAPGAESADTSTASNQCNALQSAAANGRAEAVDSILQAEPDLVKCRDSRGWTPLHYAAFHGQTGMIQVLVAHGATVDAGDKDETTPLHVAAFFGYSETIEALLKSGARIDATDRYDNTPLQDAASAGSVPAAEMLLKYHAEIDKRCSVNGFSALNDAAFKGYKDVVRLLVEHGANIETRDNQGYTPLNTAAWFERTDVVALLLANNANVNTRASDGTMPLHGAAAKGSVEIANLLLEHGARVDAGNARGFTPLHTAASDDQIAIAEVLLAHGAAINAQTNSGDTPLHWAAHDDRMDAARFLLAKGAAIDPTDKDGNTPLHWAAAMGHVDMTELLIANGADLKARTRFGCTPLRGANDYHQAATARVLREHGASL